MTATIKRRRAKTAETVPTNNAEVSEAGPANPPVTDNSDQAFIEHQLNLAAQRNVVQQRILTELCQQLGSRELQPHTLNLTRAQRAIFADIGCKNAFDIIRKIAEHRGTLALRLRVGRPEVLSAAKSRLTQCELELAAARADAFDLDDVEPGPGSPLAKQIARLQTRLGELQAARDEAAKTVAVIERDREQLFLRAPKFLRDEVMAEVAAVRVGHPTQVAENALKNRLHELSKAVELFGIESYVDPDRLAKFGGSPFANRVVDTDPAYTLNDFRYLYAARMYRPEIISEVNGRLPSIDRRELIDFMTWLKMVEYPKLKAELDRITTEWKTIEEQIRAPLIHWAATGEFE